MATPTPDDIREVALIKVRSVMEIAMPYINDALVSGAEKFLADKKINVNLKNLSRSENAKDKFMLAAHLQDYTVENNINSAMARRLIVFLQEEYGKFGWAITSTQRSYQLTFEEKEDWVGESDDNETSRSDLLDFEE